MAREPAEMNLQEFVEKAICHVVWAVAGASRALAENNATKSAEVNPQLMVVYTQPQSNQVAHDRNNDTRKLVDIDSDLAVTTSGASSAEGGGNLGVSVAVVKMGGSGNKAVETTTGTANRVRFSVPIMLPVTTAPSDGGRRLVDVL